MNSSIICAVVRENYIQKDFILKINNGINNNFWNVFLNCHQQGSLLQQNIQLMKNLKVHMSRLIAVNVFFITFICPAMKCSAQSKRLLALSKTDHTLAIVDPATLKVIARIPVGSDPHEVIASSDGKTAYVTIYGGGSLHELNVIDLVSQKPLTDVDTRPLFGPHGVTFVNGKSGAFRRLDRKGEGLQTQI